MSLIDISLVFRGENTILYFDKMVHHACFCFAVIGERKIYRPFVLRTRVYIFHPVMYTFGGTGRIIRNTLHTDSPFVRNQPSARINDSHSLKMFGWNIHLFFNIEIMIREGT